jgi:hypothetical protein
MKPKVFVSQRIPEVALDVLRQVAEVSVYPYMDRQISVDELAGGARRSDWLYDAAVMADIANQDAAASLVKFVTGKSAAAVCRPADVDAIQPEA